jgi:hypothetical protein
MAEAVATIGALSSFLQVADFTGRLVILLLQPARLLFVRDMDVTMR